MTITEKVQFLSEQLSFEGELYTWTYNADGQLLESNCPDEAVFATAFNAFDCKGRALVYGRENTAPYIANTDLGLVWACVFERNENQQLQHMYVIGPVFASDYSFHEFDTHIKAVDMRDLSLFWQVELKSKMAKIPVVPHLIFTRYTAMLHYCVTGQRIVSNWVFQENPEPPMGLADHTEVDRNEAWQAEQALLRMIQDGDLDYDRIINNAKKVGNGVRISSSDPMRQAKNSVIIFAAICNRAAVEGGLSPAQAYTLRDNYIQSIEDAKSFTDLFPLATLMYADYINRVRQIRLNPLISRHIKNSMEYIDIHVESRINLDDLSRHVGYTKYYLSRKFKDEVGCTISDYIRITKVERAKLLLTSTELSVQQISERLAYSSRSYFGEVFREISGMTPIEYRDRYKQF